MTNFLQWIYSLLQPILPKKFDENEWFTIAITILVFTVCIYLLKKHPVFLRTEVIALLLLNLLYSTVGDYTLAMKPYDFYDTVDHDSGEIMDILLQNIVYPFTIIILVFFYVRWKPNKLLYTILGATILLGLEWVSVKYFHLFTLKSWKSWYSFFFYLPVLWINIWFYEKLHRYLLSQIRQNQ